MARRLSLRYTRAIMRRAVSPFCVWLVWAGLSLANASELEILEAKYSDPTSRYNHAVLGPDAEWGALEVTLQSASGEQRAQKFILPQERVFEDLQPRLFDVDRDGKLEVIVIESHARKGGRLSIYDENGFLTSTPHIGRSFRWLAPIGIADLDGDGAVEIAYIDRPHLAKTLRIWRYTDTGSDVKLVEVASLSGLTNHRIGEDFISSGLRHCDGQIEMVMADEFWSRVMSATYQNGEINLNDRGPFRSLQSITDALKC